MPGPRSGTVLSGVAALDASHTWAVGSTKAGKSFITHWYGHTWVQERGPSGGPPCSAGRGICPRCVGGRSYRLEQDIRRTVERQGMEARAHLHPDSRRSRAGERGRDLGQIDMGGWPVWLRDRRDHPALERQVVEAAMTAVH